MESSREINTNKTIVLETNYYCNLKCIHCYIPGQEKEQRCEVTVEDAVCLFDQMLEGGFNRILFTGGEPLANPDFKYIYEEAWNRKFIISLFTNATLLDEQYKHLFVTKKPDLVRISMFGGDESSYESVTHSNMFAKAIENLEYLHQNGVLVRTKIPVLRQNSESIKEMHEKLKELGISNKLEIRIVPRFNGDTGALKYRYTPEEIIAMNLDNMSRSIHQYKQIDQSLKVEKNIKNCVENCQPFIINPEMHLQLCFYIRDWSINLKEHRLVEAIKILIDEIKQSQDLSGELECLNCSRQFMCPYCPGWARIETGSFNKRIPFLCNLVELYDEKYKNVLFRKKGDQHDNFQL